MDIIIVAALGGPGAAADVTAFVTVTICIAPLQYLILDAGSNDSGRGLCMHHSSGEDLQGYMKFVEIKSSFSRLMENISYTLSIYAAPTMECDAALPAGGHRFFGGRAAKLPGHPVQDNDSPAREDATASSLPLFPQL